MLITYFNWVLPLGDTGRFMHRIACGIDNDDHDHRKFYNVKLRNSCGDFQKRKLHRIQLIILDNNKMGIIHSTELKKYLHGKTIEEAFSYTNLDMTRYYSSLEKKGWTDQEFAKSGDLDELSIVCGAVLPSLEHMHASHS
jgi:hypothetical protein